MLIDSNTIRRATFVRELNNRFRCLVDLDGEEVLCYVPASCKLSNFIELAGCQVLLQRKCQASKMDYSLFAVDTQKGFILLNLALANNAIADQLYRRYFSFLGRRKSIKRELLIDGYKSDLFIEDTNTIVEIKTVLSPDKDAHFPTVHSGRSISQLEKIANLLDAGHRVYYLFVSLGPQVKRVYLDCDDEYNALFLKCVSKGMKYYGCALELKDNDIKISSHTEVVI